MNDSEEDFDPVELKLLPVLAQDGLKKKDLHKQQKQLMQASNNLAVVTL